MTRDWKDISIETVLNNETANTAEMGRYDRILQHRSTEATNGLANRLQGVIETIYNASQLAEKRAEKVLPKMDVAISKD